jgi:site-specific DNA recombinase
MLQNSAAIICRVSTREQEEGYSLDAQETLLREFCQRNDLNPDLLYRFSETASKRARRQKFHAFMAEVAKRRVRHIVVEKVDRLTRSGLKDLVMIDDWLEADEARHLHCVKDGIDLHKFARSGDKLNWGMRVVLAKNYTDNLREEVRKSTNEMLRKGIWPAKTPKGYIRDKSHPGCPIQPDSVRAPLIQLLFDLYDSGDWSIHHLEERMFLEGYRTARATRLKASQIHGILHDPFYTGKMLFDKKLWDGAHPPLISAEQFYRVQKRLTREGHGEGAAPFQRHEHLFRRLVFCGGCGKAITWEVQKGRVYGYCRGYKTCPARCSIREDELEEKLLPYLKSFQSPSPRFAEWLRKGLKELSADDQFRHESSRTELEASLTRLEQRQGRLLNLHLDGAISSADFSEKRTELIQEKDQLIGRLQSLSERRESFIDSALTLMGLTQDLAVRFAAMPQEKKRTMFQCIFQKISLTDGKILPEYTGIFSYFSKAMRVIESSKIAILAKSEISDFELEKISSDKQKKGTSTPSCSAWWAIVNEFRTLLCSDSTWIEFRRVASQIPLHDWELLIKKLS